MDNKIILHLWNDTGATWDHKEWLKIRRHRIIGNFIGSLANTPRQVKDGGLPLMLSKNETALLLEKGFAELRECPQFLEVPSAQCSELAIRERDLNFKQQAQLLKIERKCEIMEKASLIVKGKIAKKKKLNPNKEIDEESEKEKILEEEFLKIPEPEENHLFVQISKVDPWINIDDHPMAGWTYPKTVLEKTEYAAFRHFWDTGWTVSGGAKFGGNLVAYEGDNLLCHAQLVILCITRDQRLSPKFLVSFARLAHSVKKTAVLAYLDSSDKINFQSIEWAID